MAAVESLPDKPSSVCIHWPVIFFHSPCYFWCAPREHSRSSPLPNFYKRFPTALSFAKVLLFADDAKCIMPISSLQDCMNLQSDLSRLTEWCSTWNLFLNEDKCSEFHLKTKLSQISFNYLTNGKVISSKAVGKDLGLTISADLSWRPHYRSISSKAYKMLGLLRRVFSNCVSVSAKCSLYISLVRSRLLYLSPVWHPYLLMDINCLELVQRRSTKFITSNPLLTTRPV